MTVTHTDTSTKLPLPFAAVACGRRMLGAGAARSFSRSSLARPLRRVLGRSAPQGMTPIRIAGGNLAGARMLVELACEKYYWLGTHEPPVQATIAAQVHAGDVVYDVGAHAGFFSLLAARCAGPRGQVVAFEPHAANAARARANAGLNAWTITVRDAAVSDRTGAAPFVLDASTLEGRLAAAGEPGVAVETTTLDDALASGLRAPSLIKIDVEGAEGAVLRGARNVISRYGPLLLIEVHSDDAGREVAFALPRAYEFTALKGGQPARQPLRTGHYLGRPAA